MEIFKEITQGESQTWLDNPAQDNLGNEINSTEHTLTYYLKGPTSLTLTATANGTGWTTSITTVQSATLSDGVYYWQAFATKTGVKILLGSGSINVKKDLTNVSGKYDGRSQTEKDLEAVRGAMRAMISGGSVQEYTIGNRSLKKMLMNDLIILENRLKYDLAFEKKAEKIANGQGDPRNLYVRFKK